MVVGPMQQRNLQKPVLVICITDGEPTVSHDRLLSTSP